MKRISYTSHLELRLKLREIPYDLPRKIYETAKERYFDSATRKLTAVQKVRYKGEIRDFVLVYDEYDQDVALITLHPLKIHQKVSRIKSGRWQKL